MRSNYIDNNNFFTSCEGDEMKVYKNLAGNYGICAYEIRDESIRIKFHTRKIYLFDNRYTGEKHVQEMKKLARQGFGLFDYIHENNVIEKYASILD